MQKVGFVGIGKIGLPICANLIKSGYAVVGYRRSSLAEFEALGGIAARSPAEVSAQTDIVFTCLPDAAALEEVMRGPHGLVASARNNQVVVELGSHPLSVKQRYIAPLADKGVVFLDGEVSGTPGMVAQRKGVIYLGGPAAAVTRVEPIVAGFADLCMQGSGGSTQFAIRAPWMAERRFMPQQGAAAVLGHYLEGCKALAHEVGVPTPLLDCLVDVYERATRGIGDRDVAAIIEFFEAGSPAKSKQASQQEHTT
jgi:putative dehydrogenase